MPSSTPKPRLAVDRIEGDRAVIDIGGELVEIPAAALPEGAGEGALLTLQRASDADVLAEAEARLARLRRLDPGDGPIDL